MNIIVRRQLRKLKGMETCETMVKTTDDVKLQLIQSIITQVN